MDKKIESTVCAIVLDEHEVPRQTIYFRDVVGLILFLLTCPKFSLRLFKGSFIQQRRRFSPTQSMVSGPVCMVPVSLMQA